jgi:hypothetical protein
VGLADEIDLEIKRSLRGTPHGLQAMVEGTSFELTNPQTNEVVLTFFWALRRGMRTVAAATDPALADQIDAGEGGDAGGVHPVAVVRGRGQGAPPERCGAIRDLGTPTAGTC